MPQDWGALLRRLWSDSAVRFLVLGGLLFGVYYAVRPRDDARVIRVTHALVDEVVREHKRAGESPVDVDRAVAQYIEDELLWREGKKLGLDEQDPIVRRRVVQKMTFLAEDSVGVEDPGDAVLRSFFDEHAADFALPPRVSIRHVFFSRERRRDRAEQDARDALPKLTAATSTEDAAALGDPAIMGSYLPMRTLDELQKLFGSEFSTRVLAAQPRGWFGPVHSGRGIHLVYVERREPGGKPQFAEVRPSVYAAWAFAQQRASRQRLLDDLHRAYVIQVEPGAMDGGLPPTEEDEAK